MCIRDSSHSLSHLPKHTDTLCPTFQNTLTPCVPPSKTRSHSLSHLPQHGVNTYMQSTHLHSLSVSHHAQHAVNTLTRISVSHHVQHTVNTLTLFVSHPPQQAINTLTRFSVSHHAQHTVNIHSLCYTFRHNRQSTISSLGQSTAPPAQTPSTGSRHPFSNHCQH